MPIYEYQCQTCHHKFEILQKLSDELLQVCPVCNERQLRKQVTAAAFRLKGTGWYATDFKDKKPPEQAGKPKEGATAGNKDETSTGRAGDTGKKADGDSSKKTSTPDSSPSTSTKSTTD